MLENNRWQLPLFSITAGACAGLVVQEVGQWWPGIAQTFWLWLIGIAAFSAVVVVLDSLCEFGRWRIVPLTLVGVAIGVVVDATWKESAGGPSQNLWPVDIVFWWLISFVPMTGAFFAAKTLRRDLISRRAS